MAPYDSDSEEGDEEEFTETNILLGYASKEAGDDTISYLGGKPVSFAQFYLRSRFRIQDICDVIS